MTAAADAATLTATITELRDLLAKVAPTAGEWSVVGDGRGISPAQYSSRGIAGGDKPEVADLIVALVNNAHALIAAAEAGIEDRATIERVRALADEWMDGAAKGECEPISCAVCVKAESGQQLSRILVPRGTDDSIPEEP